MTNKEKRKQLDEILAYAAERGISVPADVLLSIGKADTQELIDSLDKVPTFWEANKLTGLIPYQNLPVYGLKTPGIVPAPNRLGLILWSHGWDITPPVQNIYTNTTGGGGRRATGGVTQHSLLTQLDYASAGHTGFQPTLPANAVGWLHNDGAGTLIWSTPVAAATNHIDQSGGTAHTYGTLAGIKNGVNVEFTVSTGAYISGTLLVYFNGQLLTQGTAEDWHEAIPAAGTFHFTVAPESTDIITAIYN